MANTRRVDPSLFRETHYLGKPASDEDRIISRRIAIMDQFPEFFDTALTCIEVGSGSGATIVRVANRFRSALAVDIFDYADAFALQQQRFSAVNCSFRQMDLEHELPTERFDRLISFEVIEHLQDENSVAAYLKVLNNGGMAAITVPNKWWIFETHGARLPLLPWNRVPLFSWLPRRIHERYANARIYSRRRIVSLLERHGFTVLQTRFVTAPMDVLPAGWLKRVLTKYVFGSDTTTIPLLSTAIFILAQKGHANGR